MDILVKFIVPFFYFIVIAFFLQRNKTFRVNGIATSSVLLFFAAKCIAGFLYSYIALKYIPNRGDIWPFYEDGRELYRTLWHQPENFVRRLDDMFALSEGDALDSQGGMAQSAFEGIKFLHFIFNMFSFGNLYTNTILFNGIAAWAFLRCWVFLREQFNSWTPGAWLFLFPSAFFYTAGIHKEGIIFVLIALLIPAGYKVINTFSVKQFVLALMFFFLFVFFKFFVATLFAAAMLLYWLLVRFPMYRPVVLLSSLLAALVLFFASGWLSPAHGLPQAIVHRQQEFLALEAASAFKVQLLEPNFIGFMKALPGALFNALLRPLPGQGGKLLYYVYSVEIFLFWAFVLYMFIKNRFHILTKQVPSLVIALFVFAIVNVLVIGYTIPNIGATMRYRSIFLPFIGLFLWYAANGLTHFNIGPADKKPL